MFETAETVLHLLGPGVCGVWRVAGVGAGPSEPMLNQWLSLPYCSRTGWGLAGAPYRYHAATGYRADNSRTIVAIRI